MSLEVEWPIARPRQTARRAAFLAHLLAGETAYHAAKVLDIPYHTAKAWQAQLVVSSRFVPRQSPVAEAMEAILVKHLRHLELLMDVTSDPEYLLAQPYIDVVRGGLVVGDLAIRLSERLEHASRPPDGVPQGVGGPPGDPDGPGDDVEGPAEAGPLAGGD